MKGAAGSGLGTASVKAGLKQLVDGLPGMTRFRANRYEAFFLSPRGFGSFRGIFSTFDEAIASLAPRRPSGADAPGYSEHHVDRLDRVFLYDYPVLFWLRELLGEGTSVFDWGGNVGVHYHAYQKLLTFPAGLTWTVCEVPSMIARGAQIARERGTRSIRFTAEPRDVDGTDVFITSGALQYIERPGLVELLGSLARPPRHIFINKLPLYAGPTFVTLQNGGATFLPQYVFNRGEFLGGLAALGYRLKGEWETPPFSCYVPFHPERTVKTFCGLYLTST